MGMREKNRERKEEKEGERNREKRKKEEGKRNRECGSL